MIENTKPKLLRVTTHDISLAGLLRDQLRFLAENGLEVVGVAADTGGLDTVRTREGIRCVDLPMQRNISLLADVKSLWRFVRLIGREKPDIVHANTPKGSLLSMIAARLRRVPVRIYYVTGLRFETTSGLMRFILKTMERITCSCATTVIPEGDGVARTLCREHITRKPLKKIHNGNINGIDLGWFDPAIFKKAAHGPADKVTFIFIGRMVRDKGLAELATAFARLNADFPDKVRLVLVGRFEDQLDPLDDSTRLTLRECPAIEHVGQQADVRPWLAGSDVLVHPSYREGFPNTIIEAGAMGLPVIVSDVNGADEVIEQDINGIIIPRRDSEALYQAMRRLVVETDTRRSMASHAREIIAGKFNRPDIHRALLERYRELLSQANV